MTPGAWPCVREESKFALALSEVGVNERIGELLVKEKRISAEQLNEAREAASAKGSRLGYQITKLGYLDEGELSEFVAGQYGVPSINLDDFEIDRSLLDLVPEEVATKHNVIPVNRAGSTLILATVDPSNIVAIDEIQFRTGYNIQPVVAPESAIRRCIDAHYDQNSSLEEVMGDFDGCGFSCAAGSVGALTSHSTPTCNANWSESGWMR